MAVWGGGIWGRAICLRERVFTVTRAIAEAMNDAIREHVPLPKQSPNSFSQPLMDSRWIPGGFSAANGGAENAGLIHFRSCISSYDNMAPVTSGQGRFPVINQRRSE